MLLVVRGLHTLSVTLTLARELLRLHITPGLIRKFHTLSAMIQVARALHTSSATLPLPTEIFALS